MTSPVVQRPSQLARVVLFYHDVMSEMKKVTWPNRAQLQDATIKIIVFVLLIGAIIALMDLGIQFFVVRLPQILFGR